MKKEIKDKNWLIKWLLEDFDIEYDKEDFEKTIESFIGIGSVNLNSWDIVRFMDYSIDEFAKINKKLWAIIEYLRKYDQEKRKENN